MKEKTNLAKVPGVSSSLSRESRKENFPSLLLFPFKNVVLLCYLLKTARTDPNKAVYHRPSVQVCP